MKQPCVYILASRRNGTIYTGVTSDLVKRVYEHRTDIVAGFTRKYRVHTLVWFEQHGQWRLRSDARKPSRSGSARGRSN